MKIYAAIATIAVFNTRLSAEATDVSVDSSLLAKEPSGLRGANDSSPEAPPRKLGDWRDASSSLECTLEKCSLLMTLWGTAFPREQF